MLSEKLIQKEQTIKTNKSKTKKVAIIGGGASGLICAIFCARKSLSVDIYEQNDKCAKKILVSGNGRCNITNKHISKDNFFGEDNSFVEYAIKNFGFDEFEKFASSIGLLLDVKDDGRVYPYSNEAKSVATLLINHAKNLGVNILTNQKVANIKDLMSKYDFVVVATGSQAASHLGGCDDGMKFAQEFSHNIILTYPSLVQLHLDSTIATKTSGAKTNAEVTLLINGKKDSSCFGDILFTSYGISGFAILDISQRASVSLMNYDHVSISINLLPNFNPQKLSSHISHIAKEMADFTILDILIGLIPIKIAMSLLEDLEIVHTIKGNDIHTKLIKKIANGMLNWRFEVKDTHGFRHAEVSGGGVDTKEINPKTFESLKQKNLYFCGEVLDIVGQRGGYNFAFAWASGYMVAQDIAQG